MRHVIGKSKKSAVTHRCIMSTLGTSVTLDEDVYRAVKIKVARTRKRDSQVIEEFSALFLES